MRFESGQQVRTKYGPGIVVFAARANSRVYVRIPSRAHSIFMLNDVDVDAMPLPAAAEPDGLTSPESLRHTHVLAEREAR